MQFFLSTSNIDSNSLTTYDQIIIEVFQKANSLLFGDKFFSKADLEDIVKENNYQVKNIADIKYTYDARRSFPTYIQNKGHFAILGLGKGKYCFTSLPQANLIKDVRVDRKIIYEDNTPALVKEVLGNDEQAILSTIQYNELISKIVGFDSFLVQNHERTSLSIGQVEIDAIYVGEKSNQKYILPISGKGGSDYLSYAQACNLNMFAKERYPNYKCISLGIKKGEEGISVVKFSDDINIAHITIREATLLTNI